MMKPVPSCPECRSDMVFRQTEKFTYRDGKPSRFWGCSNYPECKGTRSCHPDGTLMSNEITPELKKWRHRCHRVAELIWGKWEEIGKKQKAKMYAWIGRETPKGHISHMSIEELQDTYLKMISYGIEKQKFLTEEEAMQYVISDIQEMEKLGYRVEHLY